MNKMGEFMEKAVAAYTKLSKIPTLLGGSLNKTASVVTSKWSNVSVDRGKMVKSSYTYFMNDDYEVIYKDLFGTDVSSEILSSVSPSEQYRAVIRELTDVKTTKKQYLEVWQFNTLLHSIDLNALELHGDVYADSEFGALEWSIDEKKLLYIAEKKLPKSESYLKRQAVKDDDCSSTSVHNNKTTKGEEYLYRQDWGEQLVGKHLSVIVVCDVENEKFSIAKGLPESWCPGQALWAPDSESIIGVAWETEPRRLGLIFCTNRPSYIFCLYSDLTYVKLSERDLAVRSPRLSPDGGRIIWLQRKSGGPHHACHQLVETKWPLNEKGQVSILIDIVKESIKTENNNEFYGLYTLSLPRRCFTSDSRMVFFSTQQRYYINSYVVNENGKIWDLFIDSNKSLSHKSLSKSILDVQSDKILVAMSNRLTPHKLMLAIVNKSNMSVSWKKISEPARVPQEITDSVLENILLENDKNNESVRSFSALYHSPANTSSNVPLIVWPHGGPHSSFVDTYTLEENLFILLGFATLQVNYRGSVGQGDNSVHFLLTRIGQSDVDDCKLAAEYASRLYNHSRNLLFGGSHGGFLVTHLSGQYPDMFKAVVTRNPVIDVSTMINTTDIPDWLLNGNSGTLDVQDCLIAVQKVKEHYSVHADGKLILLGKSYGGFLVAHLSGQFPDMFKCAVLLNPLIDLVTKFNYADNIDSCTVNVGEELKEDGPVSEELLLKMRRSSPLVQVHCVKAPTAVLLGSIDKRVPYYQGLEYYRRLKANGCKAKLYMYEDNHSLKVLPVEVDSIINSAVWFMEHTQ